MSHTQGCQCSECLTVGFGIAQRTAAGYASQLPVDEDLEVMAVAVAGGWTLVAIARSHTFQNTGVRMRGIVTVLRRDGVEDVAISTGEARLLVSMADVRERTSDAMEEKMERAMARIKSVLGEPADLASRYGVPKSDG